MWATSGLSCVVVRDETGAAGADFVYVSHRIESGKYALEGLPCAHEEDGDAETLIVTLRDFVTGLELDLYYGVFADQDIITRAARLAQQRHPHAAAGKGCLPLPGPALRQWDLIHFHGRHAMERQMQRTPAGQRHPDRFLHPRRLQPPPQPLRHPL